VCEAAEDVLFSNFNHSGKETAAWVVDAAFGRSVVVIVVAAVDTALTPTPLPVPSPPSSSSSPSLPPI